MTLMLIRHGETLLNTARVLQPADTPLSGRGRAQAAALADRLAGSGLVALLSSDLPRALETARALAARTGLAIETSPLLQERNFGALRGQAYDSLGYDPMQMAAAPPGGESLELFGARVAAAFAWILQQRSRWNGPVAVISHGLVVKRMLDAHVARDAAMPLPSHLDNTSLSIVDAEPPHRLRLANCTRHLAGGAAADSHALFGG